MLSGDNWTKNLDVVVGKVISGDANEKLDSIKELKTFFVKHLQSGFIPFNEGKTYESQAKSQVAQWITFRYAKVLNYLKENEIKPKTEEIFNEIAQIYENDTEKMPADALAYLYFQLRGKIQNEILSDETLQNAIYSHALTQVNDNAEWCIKILTTKIPEPHPSHVFTELFFSVIKLSLSEEQTHSILRSFSNVLSRVDEKLILYDYLEKKMNSDPLTASLAVPYIVDVSVNRSVDYGDFYSVVYRAITPEALSIPGRAKFFNTLGNTVTSHQIPAQTQIAFAIKLSRMVPFVGPDVQLDILTVIQSLAKAHSNVMELLKPFKSEIANVDGTIEECTKQTLWEVLALKSSSTPIVAEAARTLGQMVIPPEYEAFDLKKAVKGSKGKPSQCRPSANWTGNLDKAIWL